MDRGPLATVWRYASCALILVAYAQASAHPTRTLAPTVLVIHGDNAPASEQRLARRVAERTRLHGGWGYNLLGESEALADEARLAGSDIIVIGQPHTTTMIEESWSPWAWYQELPGRRPPYYLPPGCTFFLFGVGGFVEESLGFVYSDRNPFNRRAETEARRREEPAPPTRLMVVITGTDSIGVRRAVSAFLRTGMLNGVVSSDSTRSAEAPFEVAPARLPATLPSWLPVLDAGPVLWSGWHQPNGLDYSGFAEIAGVMPTALWRAQYGRRQHPEKDSPRWHRQYSDMEVMIAKMPSLQAAATASVSLRAALGEGWKRLSGWNGEVWRKELADGPFYLCRRGPWILMETLPEPHDATLLRGVLEATPGGTGGEEMSTSPRTTRLDSQPAEQK